jgi:hypothetical protein
MDAAAPWAAAGRNVKLAARACCIGLAHGRRGVDGAPDLAYGLASLLRGTPVALGREAMQFDLDVALKWAQIAAYVTVPVILAVLGHLVNRTIAAQNLARDYVALGLGILREPRRAENPNLHDWAVQVLQRYSPIPFSAAARKELLETRLAGPLGRLGEAGAREGGLVVTPDGSRIVAREDDGSIRVWDLATGKQVARLGG